MKKYQEKIRLKICVDWISKKKKKKKICVDYMWILFIYLFIFKFKTRGSSQGNLGGIRIIFYLSC